MGKILSSLIALIVVCHFSSCVVVLKNQPVKKESITRLTVLKKDRIIENSGVIMSSFGDYTFWTHRDGKYDTLYRVNLNGEIVQRVKIQNVNLHDWEDIAIENENIFIGDFGNNQNARKDLKILTIPEPVQKDSFINSFSKISFVYPDQKNFPSRGRNKNFDCEAMFTYRGKTYLVSKNRGNIKTKLYRINNYNIHITQEAELIDNMKTQFILFPVRKITGIITGADISPSGKKVALLSYGVLLILTDYTGDDFFKGKVSKIKIPFSQTEGVCFLSENDLLISNEKGKLFLVKIK